ncbi:MAG: GvpL/GvpF family gas vesicle protein [Proteobacteria bacterium]|nr:GvpL/GvpF family gas vesicle protein [Pseudomonadota bacterium]MBU1583138.1 GvpL/GvpF family gas vesicle protein [Pseudomonadota bacterium]MBU2431851.1 GvpL/GvpF family gas vesicle protein [Pseudomonadota bacterium]MBU2455308.1 GvpL/GvpF family gas vesicle protein [Pseudomonadota bacterium]MBU2627155.1 GvpL/GvpF family gas vesicle protein [Pseudomonadota bacterium]
MNKRQYLYGFVFQESWQNFTCKGLDDQEVYFNNRGSLSLAMSDFKMTDFSALPQKELLLYLRQHHLAIETIMENFCIIPFKFGTMIESPDQIIKIFTSSYNQIRKKFALLRDMVELDVIVSFNHFDQVFNEIREIPSIKHFKQEMPSGSTQDLYNAQIKLGKMVNSLLDEKRNGIRKIIFDRMSDVSADILTNDITQDSMITSLAFLIKKKEHPVLERRIEDLDHYFNGTIDFKIVGPLPFYSFYTLILHKGNFKELDFARQTLNLPEKADLSEINESYKKLSKICHPDNDSHNKDLARRFEDLNKSYKIIMEYISDNRCSFLKEDVEQWIRVKAFERENAVML